MPSPRSSRERRAGRPEFVSLLSQRGPTAPDSPNRRRESGGSAPPPLPEEDCMRLNPSFVGIALSSLLAVDLWASKRLGVCAGEASAWGSARPLLKVVEVSGHGIPWLLGTFYGLCQSDSSAAREVLLNLLFGEAGRGLPRREDGARGVGGKLGVTARGEPSGSQQLARLPRAAVPGWLLQLPDIVPMWHPGGSSSFQTLICKSQCGNFTQSMHFNHTWCCTLSPQHPVLGGICKFIFAHFETAVVPEQQTFLDSQLLSCKITGVSQ